MGQKTVEWFNGTHIVRATSPANSGDVVFEAAQADGYGRPMAEFSVVVADEENELLLELAMVMLA